VQREEHVLADVRHETRAPASGDLQIVYQPVRRDGERVVFTGIRHVERRRCFRFGKRKARVSIDQPGARNLVVQLSREGPDVGSHTERRRHVPPKTRASMSTCTTCAPGPAYRVGPIDVSSRSVPSTRQASTGSAV